MSPLTAGFLRGLALAVAVAVIEAIIVFLPSAEMSPALAVYIPIVVAALRTLEGEIDRRRKNA